MRRLVLAGLVGLAACGPSWRDNERMAAAALKAITAAEADFRSNDRDGNGIHDFWTADVAGLHDLTPPGSPTPLRLIDPAIAAADPGRPGAKPYHGYWFVAIETDENGAPYRQDTAERGGAPRHNHSKFGFCAYPAEPGATGRAVFVVNEGNTIQRRTRKLGPVLRFPSGEEEEDAPPSPPLPLLKVADADAELRRTSVVPVLETPHADGRNLVWCVTFQLAWDEMAEDLKAPAPTLLGGPPFVAHLNAGRGAKRLLKDEWHVACAGSLAGGIAREVRERMAARFPGVEVPVVIPETGSSLDCVAFAYLRRILDFAIPFERYPEKFTFGGRAVIAFGARPGGLRRAASSQVRIHSYASPLDFTVEVATTSEDDRMILARLPRKGTLRETVAAALGRVDAGAPKAMEATDEFRVPCLNFDIHKRFSELESKRFGPGSGSGETLRSAIQVNQFRLDETGVKLVSSAKIEYAKLNGDPPPPPKRLVFDGPFLFLLQKKGAPLPYFALWIEDPEILCPR